MKGYMIRRINLINASTASLIVSLSMDFPSVEEAREYINRTFGYIIKETQPTPDTLTVSVPFGG